LYGKNSNSITTGIFPVTCYHNATQPEGKIMAIKKDVYANMSFTTKITAAIFLILLTVTHFSQGQLPAVSPEGVSFDTNRYIDVSVAQFMYSHHITKDSYCFVPIADMEKANPKRNCLYRIDSSSNGA